MMGIRGMGMDPPILPVPSADEALTIASGESSAGFVAPPAVFEGVDWGVFFGLFAASWVLGCAIVVVFLYRLPANTIQVY